MIALTPPTHDDIWYDQHTQLTKNQWIHSDTYDQQHYFQKLQLHIKALGSSTRTAIICGLAAATILGIPVLNLNCRTTVDLTLPGNKQPPSRDQWPPIANYRCSTLSNSDWSTINCLRTTTPERTFVDICVLNGELEALAFIEAALNMGYQKEQFLWYLDQRRCEWGTTKARKVLERARYGIDSVWETFAHHLVTRAYPKETIAAQAQIPIQKPNDFFTKSRVDLLLFDWLVIEIDGRQKYHGTTTNDATILLAERLREVSILNHGYQILQFHPWELQSKLLPTIERVRRQNPKRISPAKHTIPDLSEPPSWYAYR
ncbi:MAG: hypothetical protein Q4A82_00160 [Corynebacterium sp.]|nr:hypothetical protein [Corynebacterium sp.]